MFIRVKDKPNGRKAIQIVDSLRDGERIRQKIVRHVGHATSDEEVEVFQLLAAKILAGLKSQPSLPLGIFESQKTSRDENDERVRIRDLREEARVVEGIREVLGGFYDELGFSCLLELRRRDSKANEILRSCVLARLADPSSKRRSVEILSRSHGLNHSLDQMYRMMDAVASHQDQIRNAVCDSTLGLFQTGIDVMFFDVTTLYFESFTKDELRKFGFSKDCKFNQTQVVLALVTTTAGLPITYELFPGNKYEGHTLICIVEQLKARFSVRDILLIADRAMFSRDNLNQMDELGVRYIVAAKLRKLPPIIREKILGDKGYCAALVENELHWLQELEHEKRRLIVGYSPERAKKDRSDRVRLLERLEKKRKGRETLPVGELIGNAGTSKFLEIEKATARINDKKVIEDARWDGMHGVITNVMDVAATTILSRYRGLWQIEAAFRLNKHDLKMRPIFHWNEKRIRAHIAICFLAYAVAKHAIVKLERSGLRVSFAKLRDELLQIEASILINLKTEKRYRLPSKLTQIQKDICKAFGIRRSETPESHPPQ